MLETIQMSASPVKQDKPVDGAFYSTFAVKEFTKLMELNSTNTTFKSIVLFQFLRAWLYLAGTMQSIEMKYPR